MLTLKSFAPVAGTIDAEVLLRVAGHCAVAQAVVGTGSGSRAVSRRVAEFLAIKTAGYGDVRFDSNRREADGYCRF